MTAINLLASLNLLIDPEHIEAKRASELGKSILGTHCAFANEPGLGGGWLQSLIRRALAASQALRHLRDVGLLAQKGRGSPTARCARVVVALCAVRPWRVDEPSAVLRRNPEVVRQNYLRPLMREGRLIMTHPEEPNDRQQSYVAV